MLLALAKRLKQGDANLADGRWGPRSGVLMGDEVQVHSDGTNWYVKAFASLAAAVTFTKV